MTALSKDRVNHAYLFSGPRGCGKTTSARILARCLNCAEGPTPTPCGTCESCVELASGGPGSLDVIEIDAASHGGVEDARDLRERATFAPARDRYKVFIIDEAHMVTSAGFNALLKIVEEPPPHIKFIFATTEPDKVIGTIRSRTHHYPFRLVPPEALLAYLKTLCERENVSVDEGVLPLVIRAGGGSVRDTLSVLDQLIAGARQGLLDYETAVSLLGYTHATLLDEVALALHQADGASLFSAIDRIVQTGLDPRRFVEDLLERFRDLIIAKAVPEGLEKILRGMPGDQLASLGDQAALFGSAELSRWADVTNQALTEMTGATSPRLHLELLAARLLLPAADQGAGSIAARLDRLERHAMTGGALPDLPESDEASPTSSGYRPSPESNRQGAAAVREALAAARARKQGDTQEAPTQQPDGVGVQETAPQPSVQPAQPDVTAPVAGHQDRPTQAPAQNQPEAGAVDEPLDPSNSLNTGAEADWGGAWGPVNDIPSNPVTTPVTPSPSVPAERPEGVSPFSLVPDPNSGEDLSFGTGVPIDDVKQNAAMAEFAKRAAAQRSQQQPSNHASPHPQAQAHEQPATDTRHDRQHQQEQVQPTVPAPAAQQHPAPDHAATHLAAQQRHAEDVQREQAQREQGQREEAERRQAEETAQHEQAQREHAQREEAQRRQAEETARHEQAQREQAQREEAQRVEQQRQAEQNARREQAQREQPMQQHPAPAQQHAQQHPESSAGGSVQAFQQAWPSILEQLQGHSRVLHSMVANYASVGGFDGRTLTLAFSNSGPLVNLRNRPDMMGMLTSTISQVMRQQVEVVLTEGGSGPTGGGSPKGERRPQPASAPLAERQQHTAADAAAPKVSRQAASPAPAHLVSGSPASQPEATPASPRPVPQTANEDYAHPPYPEEPPYDPYQDTYPPEDYETDDHYDARQQQAAAPAPRTEPVASTPAPGPGTASRAPRSFSGPPIAPPPRMTAGMAARQEEEGTLPTGRVPHAQAFSRPVSDVPLRPGSTTDSFPDSVQPIPDDAADQIPRQPSRETDHQTAAAPRADSVATAASVAPVAPQPAGPRPGVSPAVPTWGEPAAAAEMRSAPLATEPAAVPAAAPGQRLSRYQQLMNQARSSSPAPVESGESEWGRPQPSVPQRMTPQPEPEPDEFVPSEDDIEVEDSALIGVPAIERLLDGMVIEQRDANGNKLEIRRSI